MTHLAIEEPGAPVPKMPSRAGDEIHRRVEAVNWAGVTTSLHAFGSASIGTLLTAEQCGSLTALYPDDTHFRSTVIMSRHGFGKGQYKYFRHPLPGLVSDLRRHLYLKLLPVANLWNESLRIDTQYPDDYDQFMVRCHSAGQTRATPLLLKYGPGDYNCLHQDLYGSQVFPLQLAVLLSEPERDFTGGEFVLTEQRPRMQSRAEVISLHRGEGVIFAVHHRPVEGTRGVYRVNMRHGVSRVKTGSRYVLGVIFHDAA